MSKATSFCEKPRTAGNPRAEMCKGPMHVEARLSYKIAGPGKDCQARNRNGAAERGRKGTSSSTFPAVRLIIIENQNCTNRNLIIENQNYTNKTHPQNSLNLLHEPVRSASDRSAPPRSAVVKSAAVATAPTRRARRRSVPRSDAPSSRAPAKSAASAAAPSRRAPSRVAPDIF